MRKKGEEGKKNENERVEIERRRKEEKKREAMGCARDI